MPSAGARQGGGARAVRRAAAPLRRRRGRAELRAGPALAARAGRRRRAPGRGTACSTSRPARAWSRAALVRRYGCRSSGSTRAPQMLAGARRRSRADPELAARIELVEGEAERCRSPTASSTTSRSPTCCATSTTRRRRCRARARGQARRADRLARVRRARRGRCWRALWRLYTRVGLPVLGRLVSREWCEVGRFLGPSIEGFYAALAARRGSSSSGEAAGSRDVRARRMSLGGGVVIVGRSGDG